MLLVSISELERTERTDRALENCLRKNGLTLKRLNENRDVFCFSLEVLEELENTEFIENVSILTFQTNSVCKDKEKTYPYLQYTIFIRIFGS